MNGLEEFLSNPGNAIITGVAAFEAGMYFSKFMAYLFMQSTTYKLLSETRVKQSQSTYGEVRQLCIDRHDIWKACLYLPTPLDVLALTIAAREDVDKKEKAKRESVSKK